MLKELFFCAQKRQFTQYRHNSRRNKAEKVEKIYKNFKKGIAFFAERCYNAEVPNGGVAQLGERLNGIQEVNGSIPSISTIGFSPDVCAQSRI